MKSKIKFKIHLSTNEVHFLDVTVSLKNEKSRTTLFTKPTESHFYLNTSSCHPSHVLKNISKEWFIRLRSICPQKSDNKFLRDKTRESKDPQTILVST